MSDHYDRYNGMEELLGTNLAEVGTDVPDIIYCKDCVKHNKGIRYIRILERNYDVAVWFNEQQARNFEQMLTYMRGIHGEVEVTE